MNERQHRQMSLRAATRDVITQVETITGRPVLVQADPSLAVLATVKMARGAAPAHLVRYKPGDIAPDYVICFQCGFILRLFANPPLQRFDFAGSRLGRARALEGASVQPQIRKLNLPMPSVRRYAEQLFDGLMTQLRSVPVGLRVDAWLSTDYRELRELQQAFAVRQLQDNQQVLIADVSRLAVSPIYEASIAMNSAFAAYWARTMDQPSFVVPYTATGVCTGGDLLAIWDAMDPHPTHDRDLVEAWADKLGLREWYEWVPYSLDTGATA
jgi:hypothetical protein